MAAAVAAAAASGEHLLVQAGTGTGKSLAYLVPDLLVDGPAVTSTATLALQAQLVDHDLPRLADAVEPLLGRRPTFAVLKGRHHYLCMARLEGTTEDEPADALFESTSGKGTRWLGEAGRLVVEQRYSFAQRMQKIERAQEKQSQLLQALLDRQQGSAAGCAGKAAQR